MMQNMRTPSPMAYIGMGLMFFLCSSLASAETIPVAIKYNGFLPHDIVVHAGDDVVWTNESTFAHTVTTEIANTGPVGEEHLPPGTEAFSSGYLLEGDSFKHTFNTPGRYRYSCRIHNHTMFGYVEVLEPGTP